MNGGGPDMSQVLKGEELYGGAVLHTDSKPCKEGFLSKALKSISRIASFHTGEDVNQELIKRYKAETKFT